MGQGEPDPQHHKTAKNKVLPSKNLGAIHKYTKETGF